MTRTSSLNCLSCKIPYQSLHSLNALPSFSQKALFLTEFCFLASRSPNSIPTLRKVKSSIYEELYFTLFCLRWPVYQKAHPAKPFPLETARTNGNHQLSKCALLGNLVSHNCDPCRATRVAHIMSQYIPQFSRCRELL